MGDEPHASVPARAALVSAADGARGVRAAGSARRAVPWRRCKVDAGGEVELPSIGRPELGVRLIVVRKASVNTCAYSMAVWDRCRRGVNRAGAVLTRTRRAARIDRLSSAGIARQRRGSLASAPGWRHSVSTSAGLFVTTTMRTQHLPSSAVGTSAVGTSALATRRRRSTPSPAAGSDFARCQHCPDGRRCVEPSPGATVAIVGMKMRRRAELQALANDVDGDRATGRLEQGRHHAGDVRGRHRGAGAFNSRPSCRTAPRGMDRAASTSTPGASNSGLSWRSSRVGQQLLNGATGASRHGRRTPRP